jgi:predicted GNAT family acetyltransferase
MDLTIFDNASDFQARVWPFLLQHEAENNLMIGLVGQLAAGKDLFTAAGERPLLALVDDGGTVAAALMTPPYRMNLSRAPDAALDLLARSLHARNVTLPGVIGPRSSAEAFSTNWARLTGRSARRGKALRIYQLDSAKPVSRAGGELCQACSTDVDLALKWMRAFAAEVNESHPPTLERVAQRIADRDVFFWKAPDPVSMACATGPTPNGIRIGAVYTPPGRRNRGYASALVAALSQYQLGTGRRFCFLFTDAANPTSNNIYQKIGYQPVCDFATYDFAPA